VQFIESSIVGIRSAVLTLESRAAPLRFVLFPMVHVAERAFYAEVADRLRSCALIVAEGGAEVPPVQARMARIRVDDLVDQLVALDLEALGIPIIWEYSRPRRPGTRAERLIAVADDSLGAIAGRVSGRFGDPLDVPNIDEVDQHDYRWSYGGRLDRWIRNATLHDRDDRLTKVLAAVHEERRHEPIAVAVVYGAAHMTAVVDHLRQEFHYFVRDAEWLTVRNAPC
jgi:hypothetical protein